MTREQFEQALGRHGGDLAGWPAAARSQAEALIATDAVAARMLADARRLDGLLAEAVRPEPVDAAMLGRILAGGPGAHGADAIVRPTGRLATWAGAAMLALLATGFAAGVALPASQGEDVLAGLVFGNSSGTAETVTEGVL